MQHDLLVRYRLIKLIFFVLSGALKAVSNKTNDSNDDETINDLALAGIKFMVEMHDVAIDLHSAVYIFHVVQMLIKHVQAARSHSTHVGEFELAIFVNRFFIVFNKLIYDHFSLSGGDKVPLCENFLSRKWYSFDAREVHGGEANSLMEQLMKGYFKDAKFSFIEANLQWIGSELSSLLAKGGILETFPCIKL